MVCDNLVYWTTLCMYNCLAKDMVFGAAAYTSCSEDPTAYTQYIETNKQTRGKQQINSGTI